jgi:hypothetical protein
VLIIWQPEILEGWKPDPSYLKFADPPDDFSENFEAAPPALRELLDRYPGNLDNRAKRHIVKSIQGVMLSSISIRNEIGMVRVMYISA